MNDEELTLCDLYDLYKNLFTIKQQNYFEDYYFRNLSFGEIAENENVSRNAVFNQLKKIIKSLKEYEEKIGLLALRKKIFELKENTCDEKLRNELESILR